MATCLGSSVGCLFPFALPFDNPACVSSKSRIARSLSSSSSAAFALAVSSSAFLRAFSALFSSFFCVKIFARAHSRQKMSPRWHETGSRAISRHKPHDPNGRKESRFSRAELVAQFDFARARSWDVKTAREVFRLPAKRENPSLASLQYHQNAGNSFEARNLLCDIAKELAPYLSCKIDAGISRRVDAGRKGALS